MNKQDKAIGPYGASPGPVNEMMLYRIPVSWEVYGEIEIMAKSLDEAIAYFDENEELIELPPLNPEDGGYVDGSFKRNEDKGYIALHNGLEGNHE